MKHSERRLLRRSALLKPAACLTLALSSISIVPTASAHWARNQSNEVIWCNGDGTPYAPILGFPADTNPFGTLSGKNPDDTWDPWIAYLDYLAAFQKDFSKYSPLSNPPNLSNILETEPPYAVPSMQNDVYAVQLNYWNSIANGTINAKAPFGHSAGHSCLSFVDTSTTTKSDSVFTITYPASPSTPDMRQKKADGTGIGEVQFHNENPNDFPYSAPFVDGPTVGAPTGYVSTYKGCSWDGNSCTMGSSIPKGKDKNGSPIPPATTIDSNAFPVMLSSLSSIPTSWSIGENALYGKPITTITPYVPGQQQPHVWDASWDIWFDKTAHTDEGQAPYGLVRGQNDGLEIMIWMNHKGSYVDAMTDWVPHEDKQGLIQPSGHIRERVYIDGTTYDVWVGRLNNPYFGYDNSEVLEPTQIQGECKGTRGKGDAAVTCGTEWNVVSFVATKTGNGANDDKRKNSASIDGKHFTNYILGNQVYHGPNGPPDWQIIAIDNGDGKGLTPVTNPTARKAPLQCPASALRTKLSDKTAPCLDQSWYLMSIQAGFETWVGGNGLSSKSFSAYAVRQPSSMVTVGLTVNGKDWDKGYCRDVWVKNIDPTFNTPGWTVQFELPYYPGKITQAWNLNYSQLNRTITASNVAAWNGVLKPGQSMLVGGFCASK